MNTTCKNCRATLTAENNFCPNCGQKSQPPISAMPSASAPSAPHSMESASSNLTDSGSKPVPVPPAPSYLPVSPSPARRFNPMWVVPIILGVLLVVGIGFSILKSASDGSHDPPPPPPAHNNIVGSWATIGIIQGVQIPDVYTFNADNTFMETQTDPKTGKSAISSAKYSYVGDQVTISDDTTITEQGTVAWDNANKFHYTITKNSDTVRLG